MAWCLYSSDQQHSCITWCFNNHISLSRSGKLQVYLFQGDVIFYFFLPEQRVFTSPIKQHMLVIVGSQPRPNAAVLLLVFSLVWRSPLLHSNKRLKENEHHVDELSAGSVGALLQWKPLSGRKLSQDFSIVNSQSTRALTMDYVVTFPEMLALCSSPEENRSSAMVSRSG